MLLELQIHMAKEFGSISVHEQNALDLVECKTTNLKLLVEELEN